MPSDQPTAAASAGEPTSLRHRSLFARFRTWLKTPRASLYGPGMFVAAIVMFVALANLGLTVVPRATSAAPTDDITAPLFSSFVLTSVAGWLGYRRGYRE